MKKLLVVFACAVAAACTSGSGSSSVSSSDSQSLQRQAAANVMCAIENQARCDHLIENRVLFGRFFTPEFLGGMDEDEKKRGRRITTKFVVEALADIKQCRRVTDNSVTIVDGMEIDGKSYTVKGTSPLKMQMSQCFITPQPEAS